MYTIIKNTPFGFIIELNNKFSYFTDLEYSVFLNNEFYCNSKKNVLSVFGLKSNSEYEVELKSTTNNIKFKIKTEKLDYFINVKDYNAKGNGTNNDTSAINLAIYTANDASVVYFPKGIYIVNQILLKSNVDLYLEKGAVIKQNTNRDDLAVAVGYQKNYDHTDAYINASWEGNPLDSYCSLVYGKNVSDIHIYGEGTIDGSGSEGGWWINPKIKNVAFRPRNIFLNNCKNITVSGLTSQNSASWNIHPFYSDNISFISLHIKSLDTSPNTDGLNPESCHGVNIIGCHFSVGDDCIALKSGKYFMTGKYFRTTKNVVVRNCYMEKGHGGIVIGSEMSCGVFDVLVTNCFFEDTERGLRIKTRRGRGMKAIADNIKFANIKMNSVRHCFVINMFYNCDPDGKSEYVRSKLCLEKDEKTPEIKQIFIEDVFATNVLGSAIFIYGLPENKIEKVTVKNCHFDFAEKRINEVPAMMDDVEIIENLGIFAKNIKEMNMIDSEIVGDNNSVLE